jgi:hypothetical protein
MSLDWILATCIGVGLAACCGFRVFVPMLVAAVGTKMGLINPVDGFEFLGTWKAIIGLSVATTFELAAYYIPWLDNLLDTIAMPAAVLAGTLLSTSFLHINDDTYRWGMGLMLGGGSAGLIQAGTSLLRLGSTATTGGVGNPIVSTGENVASIGLSVLTVLVPIFAFAVIVCVILYVAFRLLARRKRRFTEAETPNAPLNPFPRGKNGKH